MASEQHAQEHAATEAMPDASADARLVLYLLEQPAGQERSVAPLLGAANVIMREYGRSLISAKYLEALNQALREARTAANRDLPSWVERESIKEGFAALQGLCTLWSDQPNKRHRRDPTRVQDCHAYAQGFANILDNVRLAQEIAARARSSRQANPVTSGARPMLRLAFDADRRRDGAAEYSD